MIARRDREHEDAVGEREPVAHAQEQPRDVAVTCHEIQQPWKAVERRVGGHEQHERRRDLHEGVGDSAADAVVRDLGEHRLLSPGVAPSKCATSTTPTNIETSSTINTVRVWRACRACGGWNTGTAFEITSIPVIAVAPEAKARSTSSTPTASRARWGAGGAGVKECERRLDEPGDHDERDRRDEQVGRRGERGTRVAHAAQVSRDQQDDHEQADLHPGGASEGIAEVTASTPEATETATVRM